MFRFFLNSVSVRTLKTQAASPLFFMIRYCLELEFLKELRTAGKLKQFQIFKEHVQLIIEYGILLLVNIILFYNT